jgi:hypothetical protein
MSDNVTAEIRAWIECPKCGRIEKPPISVRIPLGITSLKLEKVCVPCDCCAAPAMIYLQRAVRPIP